MSTRYSTIATALAACAIVATSSALASSHREAPFITEQPKVDGTDFYLFNSYEPGREHYVTLIANYLPLQDPYGGPNYFTMDPNALYEIHVDNNGDAVEDITFQFRFNVNSANTQLQVGGKSVAIPLVQSGQILAPSSSTQNIAESYRVSIVRGKRRGGNTAMLSNAIDGSTTFAKPIDNIGQKTLPDYVGYAANFVYNVNIPGCGAGRMFVGQRKDPFAVNLGEIFDLVNTNPLGAQDAEKDDLADKNVTSLILEVPRSCLARGHEPVIGGWTTASLKQARVLSDGSWKNGPALEKGAWVQVSRLGMPLVNEVVIGLKDKDRFNGSEPRNDKQFLDYVTNPTLPALVELLFPGAPAPSLFPRTDLVAAFLTGINTPATGDLNQPAHVVPAEMLRLNTKIPATPRQQQHNLGVIGGDLAGFPNGRRPGDDVVDISLRVAMGKLIALGLYGTATQAPAGNAPLTDGATVNATMFGDRFPYLADPIPGSPN